MDNPISSDIQTPTPSKLSAGKAVLIGHLIVNLPVLIIMFGFWIIGFILFIVLQSMIYVIGFGILGFLLAWLWWSFTVPRWRRWALQHGAPPDQLQELAAKTGLVWPKGIIFEKTEFKIKE